ncbi:MAG: hypothetical protein MJY75_00575 [Bacteroidaceae bacterium]|nr:hypothetical protein [Bacteroidaceae bacterium]
MRYCSILTRFAIFILLSPISNAFASTDSVTVVLNNGLATRGKLISKNGSVVTVQQKGVDYNFTESSVKVIVSDNGNYLLGNIESQTDYNKRMTNKRINDYSKSKHGNNFIETSFLSNSLNGNIFSKYSLSYMRRHVSKRTQFVMDYGLSIGLNTSTYENHTDISNASSSKTSIFSCELPFRFLYHNTSNENCFMPYVGVVSKYNLIDGETLYYQDPYKNTTEKKSSSYLDDNEANHFQLAAEVGILYNSVKGFTFSIFWQKDITNFFQDLTTFSQFSGIGLSLGWAL